MPENLFREHASRSDTPSSRSLLAPPVLLCVTPTSLPFSPHGLQRLNVGQRLGQERPELAVFALRFSKPPNVRDVSFAKTAAPLVGRRVAEPMSALDPSFGIRTLLTFPCYRKQGSGQHDRYQRHRALRFCILRFFVVRSSRPASLMRSVTSLCLASFLITSVSSDWLDSSSKERAIVLVNFE